VTVPTVACFNVRATLKQSVRWKQAAQLEGYGSAGAWLAVAGDARLEFLYKGSHPVALAWHRGRFLVRLEDGQEVMVGGMISPPFASFQGTAEGRDNLKHWTLVHVPTRRIIGTLKSAKHCKALAAELAPVLLREDRVLAAELVERHERESA